MRDKDMMNDVLSMLNSSLTGYASVISQTANEQLRQQVQQMRNNCETSQYNFYQTATQKGFYKPAEAASSQQIQSVKSQLSSL